MVYKNKSKDYYAKVDRDKFKNKKKTNEKFIEPKYEEDEDTYYMVEFEGMERWIGSDGD